MKLSAAFGKTTIMLLGTSLILNAQCQRQYQSNCPNEWTRCGNVCVFASTEQVPWHMASEACKSIKNGSNLVVLDNREKDENIRGCLLQNSSSSAEALWIDGIFNGKQKRWVFGETASPLQYQAFSRRHPEDDSEWRCIALNKELLYRWSSINCALNKAFICEIR